MGADSGIWRSAEGERKIMGSRERIRKRQLVLLHNTALLQFCFSAMLVRLHGTREKAWVVFFFLIS